MFAIFCRSLPVIGVFFPRIALDLACSWCQVNEIRKLFPKTKRFRMQPSVDKKPGEGGDGDGDGDPRNRRKGSGAGTGSKKGDIRNKVRQSGVCVRRACVCSTCVCVFPCLFYYCFTTSRYCNRIVEWCVYGVRVCVRRACVCSTCVCVCVCVCFSVFVLLFLHSVTLLQ